MIASRVGLLLVIVSLAAAAVGQATEPVRIQACDHLTVQMDDPVESAFGQGLADLACRQQRRIEALFRIRLPRLVVRVAKDQESFGRLTGREWFMGAALVRDQLILQPVSTLRKLERTDTVLAHELIHAAVRRRAGPGCPRWLDEGLAQELAGQAGESRALDGPADLAALEARLRAQTTARAARRSDYAEARWLVRKLLRRVGERTLLDALGSICGAPDPLQVRIGPQSLSQILFRDRLGSSP